MSVYMSTACKRQTFRSDSNTQTSPEVGASLVSSQNEPYNNRIKNKVMETAEISQTFDRPVYFSEIELQISMFPPPPHKNLFNVFAVT